ncbi:MAG: CoB--CoM heterodisulfide reductase iron-sulfur subunit B family protein [Peptococcaceae bacterium]|nr:CoB--CoM heterodisulfide reductase iron-sulfur subunit B family protein [Peptococcaceae bacterium]
MDFSYYPGCSLESSAREYHLSAVAVSRALGLNLVELEDWICCGATSAHSTNQLLAYSLPASNIALAQQAGHDLVVPCAACYSRLKRTDHVLRNDLCRREELEQVVGFKYNGSVNVMSLLEAFTTRLGPDAIEKHVKVPLEGLKLACFYGCLIVRPPEITRFDNPENPTSLDVLMKSIGASPLMWSYKTECCGANLSLTAGSTVKKMVTRLLEMAEEAGAQAIVTACPLCQMNIELRRENNNGCLPSFYFTELIGLALGITNSKKWLTKHLVDPFPLLRSLSLAV